MVWTTISLEYGNRNVSYYQRARDCPPLDTLLQQVTRFTNLKGFENTPIRSQQSSLPLSLCLCISAELKKKKDHGSPFSLIL